LENNEALPAPSFTASVRGISSEEASTLIGKGGSTISSLESESGCIINVKRDTNSSEVTIRGHSTADVEDAIAAISKTLASVSVAAQPVFGAVVDAEEEEEPEETQPSGSKTWGTVGMQVEQKLSRRARKAANASLNASSASSSSSSSYVPQESAVSVKELPKEPVAAAPIAAPVAVPVVFPVEPVVSEKVVIADSEPSMDPSSRQRKLSMMTNVPVPIVAAPAPQSADEILAMLLGPQYKAKLAPSVALGSLPPTPRMVSMTGGPLGSPLIPGSQPMAAATGITPTALFVANNPPVRKMSSGQIPSVRGPPPGLTKPAQPPAAVVAGSKLAWGSKPPGISSPSKSQKDESAFPSLNQRK
jgi:hypothetical protein